MAHLTSEIFDMELADQFRIIENGLINAKGSEILPSISIFGYHSEKIDSGLALHKIAQDLYITQQKEYGEQFSATEELHTMKADANSAVKKTWTIAKLAVTDSGLRRTLGIHKSQSQTHNGWMKQFDRFYRNIDAEVLEYLTEYGYSAEKILAERALVVAVIDADKRRDDETSEAQRATVDRDEAVDTLHDWMRTFYKVAKLSLEDQPQLLEKLGILARN